MYENTIYFDSAADKKNLIATMLRSLANQTGNFLYFRDMSFTYEQIEQLRAESPGCDRVIHLNNAGAGLMPRPVIEAITSYIQLEGEIGGYEAAALKDQELSDFYRQLGKLFHANANQFAFVNHSTDAYAKALSSIPFDKGDYILTTINDYSSNQLAFLSMQRRLGIEVLRAPDLEVGGVDVQAMEEMIQRYRPRLVAVTHVPTNSGLIQPVEEIGSICQRENILYLVDGCQSVGQLPVNMQDIQCDFFTASFRKFLRGPRGAGFLYVSDKALQSGLTPLFPDLRSANWLEADRFVPKSTAQRFEYWEQAYALVMGSAACVAYAYKMGIQDIHDRTTSLAAYTRSRLEQLPGCQVLDQGKKLCGIVTFHLPVDDPLPLQQYLKTHKVNTAVAYRENALIDFDRKGVSWAMRISPHYYNTREEIDTSMDLLIEWIKAS